MSASLEIHLFENITEKDLRAYFSTTVGHYFGPTTEQVIAQGMTVIPCDIETTVKVQLTPFLYIGETDDNNRAVNTIAAELQGKGVFLLDSIRDTVINNLGVYPSLRNVNILEAKEFFEKHKGKQTFVLFR